MATKTKRKNDEIKEAIADLHNCIPQISPVGLMRGKPNVSKVGNPSKHIRLTGGFPDV